MPVENLKYCEYFDIKEKYFPCIDESAIHDGVDWDATYPHETFINMIDQTEKMLSGKTNRSLWIHGAYGTGKSRCAYTLKKILDASKEEVAQYWDKYEPLRKNNALLKKIESYKDQGIITAYRYASGSITIPQQLFLAVQESIKKALEENKVQYKGENSLKESAIAWLEDTAHNDFMNALLKKPEWQSAFSQSTADEIIKELKKDTDVSSLMDNIFKLAAKEGITALDLTSDSLRDWIIDIIDKNNIKIVFIWDEFSDFFRQNSTSLGEFQKIVSVCQEKPFYFVIVTHPLSSLAKDYDSGDKTSPWSVVQNRFDKVEITLPDNIAFDLIGHAFDVKAAAKDRWKQMTDDLNSDVNSARAAVVKAANIKNENVMREILPLHPMAALVLKNIATAFQANQRSMFDFIKLPKDMNAHAFQWFIENSTPLSDRPFLTVDMLWDFFYDKGKDYLTSDIRLILDTFPQQKQLNDNEKIVLKTILIMQSIDQRLGGSLPILKPTDQNISYAFEGDEPELDTSCKNIAKALVKKGVLIENPIGDGKKAYSAAVLAGDGAKIEKLKNELRTTYNSTKSIVSFGDELACALNLTPALKLRFALKDSEDKGKLPIVTSADFKKTMDSLKNKDVDWHFYAVLAVAKDDSEAQQFRTLIRNTMADDSYNNITVIDALSTPLGIEAYEHFIDFEAMSQYYQGNNNQQSKESHKKAEDVIERGWKDRIYQGRFVVYSVLNKDGEVKMGANEVHQELQTIVLSRFAYVQDFCKGLTESQLKPTLLKQVARYGIADGEVKGVIKKCEDNVLGNVWSKKDYWEDEDLSSNSIVIIKKAVDKLISDSFKKNGKISIDEIYDYLETTFGFSTCNLSAFITSFILKEYSGEPYRYMDSEGHRDAMTPDRLSEMISNAIGKKTKPTYIVNLTPEEKAFYELSEAAWDINANTITSPSSAASLIRGKMRELSYPAWCLQEIDTKGVMDIVNLYIKLIQSTGDEGHDIANMIGQIAMKRPDISTDLKSLLTPENCKKGMELFLERFENRKCISLAQDIGAENRVLQDVKKLFEVQYSALWNDRTGEDEIRKLITEYEVIKLTNNLLNVSAHSKGEAFKTWKDHLMFVGYSCEAVKTKKPTLMKFFDHLLAIAKGDEFLPDSMKSFYEEINDHYKEIKEILSNPLTVFIEIYKPYLEGFSDHECEEIKNSISSELFTTSVVASNNIVKKTADDYRKNQVKTQMFKLWNDKTNGSKTPWNWSDLHRTPILCCIDESEYDDAKKAFSTLNSSSPSETEIKEALSFLEKTNMFKNLQSADYRDTCFVRSVLGDYSNLLTDINAVRDKLESTTISAYNWYDSPVIKNVIKDMAKSEYSAGGSDKVVSLIDSMDGQELKKWLTDTIREDMELGMKIIINKEG